MKKITAFLLLISLILPTVPILAETKEIWEPTIAVSDFTYSKDTLTGGVMTIPSYSFEQQNVQINGGLLKTTTLTRG